MPRLNPRFSGALIQAALFLLFPYRAEAGDTLSAQDRRAGVVHLEESRSAILQAVRGLSDGQWKFREAPGRWSVAEIVEHLALAEQVLFDRVRQGALKSRPAAPGREYARLDKTILMLVPDRSNKATAAPGTEPAMRWPPNQALDEFRSKRQQTIEFLRTAVGLRDRVSDSPFGEPMDDYQWLLFISAHTGRHLKQIDEVKAAAGFPRK